MEEDVGADLVCAAFPELRATGSDKAVVEEKAVAEFTEAFARFAGGGCAIVNRAKVKNSATIDFAIILAPFCGIIRE
ncbi:MAG: hypothetical protein WCE73_19445 [Candidatus Angelobacter sp.]